jgi:hypothetical protein
MLRAWAAFLVASLVLHPADAGRAQAPGPGPLDLLEQYARGEGGRAVTSLELVPHGRLEALGNAIQKAAPAWLKAADPAQVRNRRLAAATLALDLAHVGLHTEWRVLSPLVEWGCALVRQNPAGQSEHAWHLASVALAGAARDTSFLIDPPISRGTERVFKHLNHAEDQFPADPRWRLARAMALAFNRMSEGVRDDGGSTAWPVAGVSNGDIDFRRLRATSRTIEAFTDLLAVPSVAAEAHLHLGHQRFIARQLEQALFHYQEAGRLSEDPQIRYLAYFLAGRLFELRRVPVQAERHYRMALDILPNTQSAATAVAAARFIQGVPAESYGILEAAFSSNPRPPDPWRLFFLGDYRFWPRLIQRLHTALQ